MFRKRSPASTDRRKDLTKRQVFSVTGSRRFPSAAQWRALPRIMSTNEWRVIGAAAAVIVLSLAAMAGGYVVTHRVDTPAVGGEYVEGLVGEPRFINPIYAVSQTDRDLASLVYSGLIRWTPDGYENDLARDVRIADEGRTYIVELREGARFHNGEHVRARDVISTVKKIQDPEYRSPYAGMFRSANVVQLDDRTIAFELEEPFAPFMEALAVGILPADIWDRIPAISAALADENLQPVGSGPYKFKEFKKNNKGNIRSYTLERFADYHADPALVETLTFKFYADEEEAFAALENRNIEGMRTVPPHLIDAVAANGGVTIHAARMPREVILFFNQELQPIFEEKAMREAAAYAIDKNAIISEVLDGAGAPLMGPIPPGMPGADAETKPPSHDLEAAREKLDEAGYELEEGAEFRTDPAKAEAIEETEDDGGEQEEGERAAPADTALSFALTTVQDPELIAAAEAIARQLAAVGIRTEIDVVSEDEAAGRVLEPRAYEMLLWSFRLRPDPDPYLLWHSSQAEDGLNLADYANRKADDLIEQARAAADDGERAEIYAQIQGLIAADLPAIFLYQSDYRYAIASKIRNVSIPAIITPADRFADITSWYIKTKKRLR